MQTHPGAYHVADLAGLQARRRLIEAGQQFVGLEGAQQAAALRGRPFGVLTRQRGEIAAAADFLQHALGFGLPPGHGGIRGALRQQEQDMAHRLGAGNPVALLPRRVGFLQLAVEDQEA